MMVLRYLFIFFTIIASSLSSSAQVTLFPDDVNGGVGSQVVVPVRANNFVDLVSMQGTIHFDPAVVSYSTIEQLGLPGLSLGSFGTTQVGSGTITFSWFDADLSGESVADSSVLFGIRFDLIGSPGDSSLVWFDDSPTLLEFVDNSFATQGYQMDTGVVLIDGQPSTFGLSLFADSVTANQNDTILVPVRVNDFNHIIGTQGTLGFDPLIADYLTVEQFGVPGMTLSNFGETQVDNGVLTFSWNSAGTAGSTLPDSSVLFAIKYHVIGPGGSETDVPFLGSPTPMEIVDSNLTVLNPYLAGGHIEVLPDTSAVFSMLIDTVVGMQTQLVSVPIRAYAFNDILSMQGTLDFDTSVIVYNSVVNYGLPYMSTANFGTTQVNDGRLSFSWYDQDLSGETLVDSTIIFELVFTVVGGIGEFGEVLLNSTMTPIEFVEIGNLPIPYVLDSGGVLVDSLGAFINVFDPPVIQYCAGDSIGVLFQTSITPNSGNIYMLELSDAMGSFASPDTIGTLNSILDSTSISGIIPTGTPYGTGYKVRVNSTSPALYGNESNVNLTIEYYEDSVQSLICFGDSLFLQGAWQTSPGFYLDTLSTINGCDSVVVTDLTFTSAIVDSNVVSICQGDSVFAQGSYQFTPGWYVDSLTAITGCDSLIRTNITVNPVFNNPVSSQICNGDSLFLEGAWQFNEGLYIDTLNSVNGCDSLISTTISFFPSDSTYLTDEICFGDSVFLQGAWQSTSGIYTDLLTSQFGCDSALITTLNVLDLIESFDTIAVCFGDSVFAQNGWQTVSGDYIDTLTAISGCDSLVRTNFTVKPLIVENVAYTICEGDSLFLEGAWQLASGSFVDSLFAVDGCDSLVMSNLTVTPTVYSSSSQTICSGDSIMIHGVYQSLPGVYVDTFPAISGCDSIATFELFNEVHPLYTEDLQICVGDSLFLQGQWQTSTGVYLDTLSSALGCDSIIQTSLTVISTIVNPVTAEFCLGDSLFLAGAWQTTSGVYNDTLQAAAGCDSVVVTTLTVLMPTTGTDVQYICQGDSIQIGGVYQNTAGNYPVVLTGSNGCDSTVDVQLIINPVYFIQETIEICQGDSALIQGAYYSVDGVHLENLSTTVGCDSIIERTLVVNPNYIYNDTYTICQGDSILIHGQYESVAGNYLDTVQAITGCDSIIDIQLNVNPTSFEQQTFTICQGDSLFVIDEYLNAANVYLDTLNTINGCDSIIETTLIVNPTFFVQESLTICQGDSALLQNMYQTTSGIYYDTTATILGCDSIVETSLTVTPAPVSFDAIVICQGDSVFVGNAYQTISGVYYDTTSTALGCDSIIETTLTVNPAPVYSIPLSICQGDSVLLGGAYQVTSGVYYDTTSTALGCDSITETTLTVNPAPVYINPMTICQGDSVFLEGAYQSTSGVYYDTTSTALGCDSITETTLTVNPAPVYTEILNICQGDSALIHGVYQNTTGNYIDTLQTMSGCDSIIDVNLVVNPTFFVQDAISICQGDSIMLEGTYQSSAGVYLDTTATIMGCDSIVETTLSIIATVTSNDAITICDGDSVLVNGNYLSSPGAYTDTLQAATGCDSLVTTTISVTVIDNTVTVNSPTLTANYGSAQSYQWINCNSGNNIANGTTQDYTAISNGSYQVQITDQGCQVLSDCYDIVDMGIEEYEDSGIEVYPNPTYSFVNVRHGANDSFVQVIDVFGKELMSMQVEQEFIIDLSEYPSGIYFMKLNGRLIKLIKN